MDACIYIRSVDESDQISVQLLCGKSRVAPLKKNSLPRLELQAAPLLAQLKETVTASLEMKFEEEHFRSDSTITLCWIKSFFNCWKTFVANRASGIQNLTIDNWHHVCSEDNPADLISQRINSEELRDSELWWKGPAWLSQPIRDWPRVINFKNNESALEEKKCERTLIVTTNNEFKLLKRFSSFNKLLRVSAYCLHFISNVKKGSISSSKQVSSKSNLYSLDPFIDPRTSQSGRSINQYSDTFRIKVSCNISIV